jgi:hypothetical protein
MKLRWLIPCIIVVVIVMVASGCSKKVSNWDTVIESIEQGNIKVDCSPKKYASDDIGYSCGLITTDETIYEDVSGNSISIDQFKIGDDVRLYLTSPQVVDGSISQAPLPIDKMILK